MTDYKVINTPDIVDYILEITNTKGLVGDWSDTCHADVHINNGHFDSHTDTHPDCTA